MTARDLVALRVIFPTSGAFRALRSESEGCRALRAHELLSGVRGRRRLDGARDGRGMGEFAAGQDGGDEDQGPAPKNGGFHEITKPENASLSNASPRPPFSAKRFARSRGVPKCNLGTREGKETFRRCGGSVAQRSTATDYRERPEKLVRISGWRLCSGSSIASRGKLPRFNHAPLVVGLEGLQGGDARSRKVVG
jgi:hypothetical protein